MSNKLLTIVGMGPGNSHATARRFGKEGYRIAMIGRNTKRHDTYKKLLAEEGIDSFSIEGDAGNENSLTVAFDRIEENAGSTDVLLYNVFTYRDCPPTALKYQNVVEDFKSNVGGALVATQRVLPKMLAKGAGTILFTGGGMAFEPVTQFASLALGKAALRNLCFSLYAELKPKNIHVATVTICGFVKPDTRFAPDIVAQAFWDLHNQKQEEFEREIIIK
jgi:short-subunit dehydrogenase